MKCQIPSQLYEWAIRRSQIEPDRLHRKFSKLDDWITGKKGKQIVVANKLKYKQTEENL